MNFDYLGLVLKDIKRRKLSSFLTLFAISLGIASIYLIFLITIGLGTSFENQFDQYGSNRLYISSTSSSISSSTQTKGLTDSSINLIEGKPYVKEVYPYYFKSYQAEYSKEFARVSIIGSYISDEFFDTFNLDVAEGRIPKENEKYSLVIGPVSATDSFSKDLRLGSNIYIEDVKFKVVGILESLGNPQDDKQIYANIDTLREIDGAGDSVGVLDVIIDESYDINLAKENLQILLDNRLGEDTTEVTSPDQILGIVNNLLSYINLIFGGIGVISLLVGTLGIINTMFVIITEKTRDIGIMKSIGATNNQVLIMFIFQAGVFGFLGAILGISIGYGLVKIAEIVMVYGLGWTFVTFPFHLMGAVGLLFFGFFIGCLSGFLPAYKGSRVNIVEATRK